jgi:hypothetical protein
MTPYDKLEKLTTTIAGLGRDEVKTQIKGFHGRFRLDFSDEYLDSLTLDRLRHILLAAVMTTFRKTAS